jgi:hypothetical protein
MTAALTVIMPGISASSLSMKAAGGGGQVAASQR